MKTKSETYKDKSEWRRGPWDDEPDKIQWFDEASGLPCLIVRNRAGALCGYVGVPPSHPLFGVEHGTPKAILKEAWARRKETPIGTLAAGPVAMLLAAHADDNAPAPEDVFEVHGGLTYSGHCSGKICHEKEYDDPEAFWFGFDCGHYRDLQPAINGLDQNYGDEDRAYRDLAYVQAECRKLARQLKEVSP